MASSTFEQLKMKSGAPTSTGAPQSALQSLAQKEGARVVEPQKKKSVLGKVAEFVAPSVTRTVGKVRAGEKVTARDIIGSGLEIGSFLIPAGAIGKTLGLGAKGAIRGAQAARALSLGQKVGLGSAVGAASGGLSSAGRAVGAGEDIGGIARSTIGGTVFGAAGGAAVPVAAAGVSRVARGVTSRIGRKAAEEAEQKVLFKTGAPDARIATKKITPQGKIVTDKAAKEAVRQGIPEADVALVKVGSKTDKSKMAKMLSIRENQLTNKRVTARATDVVGDTFIEQAKFIQETNKKAGQALNKVAMGLKGKKVDSSQAISNFIEELQNSGVRMSKKTGKLSFIGSDFEGIKSVQTALNNVWSRALRVSKSGDALELHRIKNFIDEIVSYGKATEGLSGKAERILKSFRRNADLVLDTNFKQYNKVNTIFAETIGELSKISQSMGRSFRLNDNFADSKAGLVMRRILGNTQSRSAVLQLLESMQNVAKKHGLKIEDDIITQANFADLLEKALGSEAPTSFLGQIERGIGTAQEVAGVARDLTRGDPFSAAFRAGAGAIQRARGINQANQIKALKELLGVTENKVKPKTVFGKVKKSNFGKK